MQKVRRWLRFPVGSPHGAFLTQMGAAIGLIMADATVQELKMVLKRGKDRVRLLACACRWSVEVNGSDLLISVTVLSARKNQGIG